MSDLISTPGEARATLIRSLREYLLGPIGGDVEDIPAGVWADTDGGVKERISQRPDELYHIGILYPAGTELNEEEDDSDLDSSDADSPAPDGIMALANAMRQSAMGLSFKVDSADTQLKAECTWAEYEVIRHDRTANKKQGTLGDNDTEEKNGSAEMASGEESEADDGDPAIVWKEMAWKRRPVGLAAIFSAADLPGELRPTTINSSGEIDLVAMKHTSSDGIRLTVSLVNRRKSRSQTGSSEPIYQAKVIIEGEDDCRPFLPVAAPDKFGTREFWAYELLFHGSKQFAVGHGCSADWSSSIDGKRVGRIETEWLPEQEVWKASSAIESIEDTEILELASLDGSKLGRRDVLQRLEAIASEYEKWIDGISATLSTRLREEPNSRAEKLRLAGEDNIALCRKQAKRLSKGIEFLRDNDKAWKAFCLANRAMKQSMERDRPGITPSWFPFQLAFILISIPSTGEPQHKERDTLDLIWFPTGGGKTEAYLGLAAWTIFFRRLSYGARGYGTAILTRYTLRFLTSQQFERSARMIMACEIIRRESKKLGDEPINIGLYVGGKVTPNYVEDAKKLLDNSSDDDRPDGGATTLPIGKCPWCSTALSMAAQKVVNGRLITACASKECEFESGIPIVVVDDEIYENPPTFVVGTIDKFALMPWAPQISSLFGRGRGVMAPDLIIQDELHLISDSLGSLAGLYESVVDILCGETSAKPKIIGSTATIRRANEQVKALFDRKLLQFPPSGTDARDSFFFRESRKTPGRLYMGVHAQGRSPKHTQPLIAGILLQFSGLIENEALRDPFHTLILYFNSLRELGGAFVLVEDDVSRYLKALSKGGLLPDGLSKRSVRSPLEVSGNIPSELIGQYTRHLAVSLCDEDPDREPEDVVLATNMISVGVDVGRLGSMVVVGQPKTTSEYIQATSRVGRPLGSAGLVVTLYNWSRPRDRSHYENFRAYHQAFYRYVEAQSVTPFSARARDRALHAAVFALARAELGVLRPNCSASKILERGVEERVRALSDKLIQRIQSVETDVEEVGKAKAEISEILDEWIWLAKESSDSRPLAWTRIIRKGDEKPPKMARIMIGPDDPDVEFPIQFSMRDVDAAASLAMRREK